MKRVSQMRDRKELMQQNEDKYKSEKSGRSRVKKGNSGTFSFD